MICRFKVVDGVVDLTGKIRLSEYAIYFHETIKETELWENKPFSFFQSYLDLSFMANRNNGKVDITIYELANLWGWHESKVEQFLNALVRDGMLEIKSNNGGLLIKVIEDW